MSDKKCPYSGGLSIRGHILTGTVKKRKEKGEKHAIVNTIVVRRDYFHFIKKYQRYEKRHSNISAHLSPCLRCKEGDTVVIGQCRPLSKTVRFNVLRVTPAGSVDKKTFKTF